jgi:molybdenum cofactor cytidylyltransferase
MNVGLVILAAGASSRMGTPKQILPVFGKPMIVHLIDEVFNTKCHPVTVVLGANKDKIVPLLDGIPVTLVDNPFWSNGLGSSVRMGLVGSYLLTKGIEALIYITSDMPYVNASLINQMIKLAEDNDGKTIIASKYAGKVGIPALFKKAHFEEILELNGQEGARGIIEKHKNKVLEVTFENGKTDLDTKEDYYDFLQSKN